MEAQRQAPAGPFHARLSLGGFRVRLIHVAIVIGGLTAMAYGVLGVTMLQQKDEAEKIDATLAVSQRTIANQRTGTIAELEQQVREAETRLGAMAEAAPNEPDPRAFTSRFVDLSNTYKVDVMSLQTRKAREQVIGQTRYSVNTFGFNLRGSRGDVIAMLASMENDPGRTVIVQSARYAPLDGGVDRVTLEVELGVYSKAGAVPAPAAPASAAKPK